MTALVSKLETSRSGRLLSRVRNALPWGAGTVNLSQQRDAWGPATVPFQRRNLAREWDFGELGGDFAMPNLKANSYCQLSDARVYGRTADHAECWRREISVRICKLRMVKRIEEFTAKFNPPFFVRPREGNCL